MGEGGDGSDPEPRLRKAELAFQRAHGRWITSRGVAILGAQRALEKARQDLAEARARPPREAPAQGEAEG